MKNFETTFSLYYRGKKKLNIFINQCLFLNNIIYKLMRIYLLFKVGCSTDFCSYHIDLLGNLFFNCHLLQE